MAKKRSSKKLSSDEAFVEIFKASLDYINKTDELDLKILNHKIEFLQQQIAFKEDEEPMKIFKKAHKKWEEELDDLDKEKAINKIRQGFSRNLYHYAREWQYKDIKPRIIVEKLLVEDDDIGKTKPTGIVDYKFFVFNGVPKFYYASRGLENHATASISFYDLNGNKMPFSRSDYKDFGCAITPIHLDEMIKLAQKAGETIGSDFIRVDFYEIGGKVYFSEFTLHPCAGLMPIVPQEWDSILGDWIKLHKNK